MHDHKLELHMTSDDQIPDGNATVEQSQLAQLSAQLIDQGSPVDIIRVARLRMAVIDGDYRIDLYRIAAALIDPGTRSD